MNQGDEDALLDNRVSDRRKRLGRRKARCCSIEERLDESPRIFEKLIEKELGLSGAFGSVVDLILLPGVSPLTQLAKAVMGSGITRVIDARYWVNTVTFNSH